MTRETINHALDMIKPFKADIDTENNIIVVPLDKGMTEQEIMEDGRIGRWFIDNGFTLSFRIGDYEYETKGAWTNRSGFVKQKGHKAYLRNRTIMTITWEEQA